VRFFYRNVLRAGPSFFMQERRLIKTGRAFAFASVVVVLLWAATDRDDMSAMPSARPAVCWTSTSAGARPAAAATALRVPPYSKKSPLSTPIGRQARVDATSPQKIGALAAAIEDSGFVVALRRWTVSVFLADEQTSFRRIPLTADWAPRRMSNPVPLPARARPDPGGDGHMVVVDPTRGCEYDFYAAHRSSSGSWSAGWQTRLSIDGRGTVRGSPSTRASGFGLLAGLIFPRELTRGRIDHALVFSSPLVRNGRPVPPATESAGGSSDPNGLPMGTRVRLNPDLDLSKLPLTRYEKTIARALQIYGMYLADTGGTLTLYAVHPESYESDPYGDIFPAGEEYPSLGHIPLDQLQVLLPG
jgi:hypothetical protein